MFKLLPDWVPYAAAVVLGIAIGGYFGFLGGTWHGKEVGKAQAAAEAAANSVRILKERGKIDEQVNSTDAAVLCGSYGLSDDDKAECVRRVQQADAQPGNIGDDPPR